MPRLNVYVSEDLKARMDVAGDGANWSGVAQRAFESELTQMENKKELMKMANTIERLSKSKEFHIEAMMANDSSEGRAAGKMWAAKDAGYPELKSVAALLDSDDESEIDVFMRHVAYAATGEEGLSRSEARDFFGEYLEFSDLINGDLSLEAVFGFVAGAAEFWDDVEGQL
jgi:hypothetical protein